MTAWASSYHAALEDLRTLCGSRGLMTPQIVRLFDDLTQDALVIAHEQDSKLQRAKLRAAGEALPLLMAPHERAHDPRRSARRRR